MVDDRLLGVVRRGDRGAEHQIAARAGTHGVDAFGVVAVGRGEGGLRPKHDVAPPRRRGQLLVARERRAPAFQRPLRLLGQIALHDGHRAALRALRPRDRAEQPAASPNRGEGGQQPNPRRPTRGRQRQRQGGSQDRGERHREHAANRRVARERRVDEGVAGEQPRESGEQPGERPLGNHPSPREVRGVQPTAAGRGAQAVKQPAAGADEQRHADHEQGHQPGCERGRRRPVDVDGNVDPRRAHAVLADPETPAASERLPPAPGTAQHPEQRARGDQHQRPKVERRQTEGQETAGENRKQADARPAGRVRVCAANSVAVANLTHPLGSASQVG